MSAGNLITAATNARRALRAIEPAEIRAERVPIKVFEPGELVEEGEIDGIGRAVALLGNYQFGYVLVLVSAIVLLFAIDERNHIRVLFNGSRFA